MSFKRKDRVTCSSNAVNISPFNLLYETGTIILDDGFNVCIEFDNRFTGMHNGAGYGKESHCWWFPKDQLNDNFKLLSNNSIELTNKDIICIKVKERQQKRKEQGYAF